MKTTMLFLGATLLAAVAPAQDIPLLSRTIFKLSPQHFTHNSLKAGVERLFKNKSASLALFVTGTMEKDLHAFPGHGYDGVAGELQVRKYVSPFKAVVARSGKVHHQGIYGAAYAQAGAYAGEFSGQSSRYDPSTGIVMGAKYHYTEHIGNWGLGFTLGYQRTFWHIVFAEAFVGGGLQFSDRIFSGQMGDKSYFSYYSGITDPHYRGILPKMGIMIGVGL